MPKTMPFRTALVLGLLACGAVLAQAPIPAEITAPSPTAQPATTPLLELLDQAVDSPLAGAQPRIVLCSPPTSDVCANKQCECQRFTCARCGIKSFTCNESTGQSSCVCKSC